MRQPLRPTSGRLGNQIVYLTNSAGGLRAMKTTAKTTGHNIAGIYTYESIGYVFPIGDPEVAAAGITLCTSDTFICAFGPLGVDPEDFKKLARLKITFAWGDNRPEDYSFVIQSRLEAKLLNEYAAKYHLGGHAEVLKLADPNGRWWGAHGKHAYCLRRHGQREGQGSALQVPEEEPPRQLSAAQALGPLALGRLNVPRLVLVLVANGDTSDTGPRFGAGRISFARPLADGAAETRVGGFLGGGQGLLQLGAGDAALAAVAAAVANGASQCRSLLRSAIGGIEDHDLGDAAFVVGRANDHVVPVAQEPLDHVI